MSAAMPPAPIWHHSLTGIGVWVIGGLITMTMRDGRADSLLPSQIDDLGEELASASPPAA